MLKVFMIDLYIAVKCGILVRLMVFFVCECLGRFPEGGKALMSSGTSTRSSIPTVMFRLQYGC